MMQTEKDDHLLPGVIPVFPLAGALLLPRGELPLNIFENRYLQMVRDSWKSNRIIGMIQPRDDSDDTNRPALYDIGCAGRITSLKETSDNRLLIKLKGLARFRVSEELRHLTAYRQVKADYSAYGNDLVRPPDREGIDRKALIHTFDRFLDRRGLHVEWTAIEKAPDELLVNSLAMISPFPPAEKQALLEASSVYERAKTMIMLMEFAIADITDADDNNPPALN